MAQLQKAPWADWQTVRLIGRGSFGTVYEIQRKLVDDNTEHAALKVITIPQNADDIEELYSEGYDSESITATFHTHLKGIVTEYSFMRKMGGSANIVNCQDIQYIRHDDGIGWDIYIRMELLTPLMKALPVDVPEADVIKLGKDICSALVLCKKHGVVHRDIKPQNIFISSNGDYKLGDFGIAKTVEKTMSGTKIGTYKYMAPEVYHNQPYGSSADIYSLGLVLYWLLNRRRMPFMPLPPEKLMAGHDEEARRRRLAGEKLPAPAHGSDGLIQIVLKACAYDPMDRYASAAEMLADLNQLTAGATKRPPVIVPPSPIEPLEDDAPTTGPVFAIRKGPDAEPVAVEDPDATVGPIFSAPKQPEPQIAPYEFFDKTVRSDCVASPATVEKRGPVESPEPEPETDAKGNKSMAGKIALVTVIILLVAGLLFLVLRPVVDRISDNTVLKFESSKTERMLRSVLDLPDSEPIRRKDVEHIERLCFVNDTVIINEWTQFWNAEGYGFFDSHWNRHLIANDGNNGYKNKILLDLQDLHLLPNLKEIDVNNAQVINLETLSSCANLSVLSFQHCQTVDLNEISTWKNVQAVKITSCKYLIADSLDSTSWIHTLHISDTHVENPSALGNLLALRDLALDLGPIPGSVGPSVNLDTFGADLTFLMYLPKLTSLSLYDGSDITDLSPLAKQTKLKKLTLTHFTHVTDISPIGELKDLEELKFTRMCNVNYSVISGLTNLKRLNLSLCEFANISFVSSLSNLEELSLTQPDLRDLSPLANLKELTHLSIWDTAVSDLSAIKDLNLTELNVSEELVSQAKMMFPNATVN